MEIYQEHRLATRAAVLFGIVLLTIGIVQFVRSGEFHWFMALWVAVGVGIIVMRVLQLRAHRRTGVYRKRWGRIGL
ncbi:hypothetical protein [Micromonospora kangleipakensis]|nr:hypothetical protein [Micromonospora kangleipakensis]